MEREALADGSDETLVKLSVGGNARALETLVRRYKDRIYNLAIRMTGNAFEADDVTQEVLIKIITKLSSFRFGSAFGTWLYRITVNHFLTMKRKGKESVFTSFDSHREFFETLDGGELRPGECPDRDLVIEETKHECLLGMLLCLDREQRLVFMLGGIFSVGSREGAEILGTNEAGFRKKLSRARADLRNYMENNCGLVNPGNSCRCSKKAKAALEAGYIRPDNLQFAGGHLKRVDEFIRSEGILVRDVVGWRETELFRKQPYKIFEDARIAALIDGLRG